MRLKRAKMRAYWCWFWSNCCHNGSFSPGHNSDTDETLIRQKVLFLGIKCPP